MNIKSTSKSQYDKYLIVSGDYPISWKQIMVANLVIIIWNDRYEPYDTDNETILEIQQIVPVFSIKKNKWGFQDENVMFPISLLPDVLKNPSGTPTWSKKL